MPRWLRIATSGVLLAILLAVPVMTWRAAIFAEVPMLLKEGTAAFRTLLYAARAIAGVSGLHSIGKQYLSR